MVIGTSPPRRDGMDKLTGRSLYSDDLRPDGVWYGATVRSTRAHARLRSVRRSEDFDWSNVVFVTAADIPGLNVVSLMTDDQPVLADGLVRHVTEPIALVAAPTRELEELERRPASRGPAVKAIA